MNKTWNDLTKKEKLANLRIRIRTQEDYVKMRMPKHIYSLGPPDKQSKAYLKRLKKQYKDLGGK